MAYKVLYRKQAVTGIAFYKYKPMPFYLLSGKGSIIQYRITKNKAYHTINNLNTASKISIYFYLYQILSPLKEKRKFISRSRSLAVTCLVPYSCSVALLTFR